MDGAVIQEKYNNFQKKQKQKQKTKANFSRSSFIPVGSFQIEGKIFKVINILLHLNLYIYK